MKKLLLSLPVLAVLASPGTVNGADLQGQAKAVCGHLTKIDALQSCVGDLLRAHMDTLPPGKSYRLSLSLTTTSTDANGRTTTRTVTTNASKSPGSAAPAAQQSAHGHAAPAQTAPRQQRTAAAQPVLRAPTTKQQSRKMAGSTGQITELLRSHNEYRALHNAPPLRWSPKLATESQDWANGCKFEHGSIGENLAVWTGTLPLTKAVDLWYEEISDYNFARPGFKRGTGHFTQVVWQSSRDLGCAAQYCPGLGELVVCRYEPAGNLIGAFPQNVVPPR